MKGSLLLVESRSCHYCNGTSRQLDFKIQNALRPALGLKPQHWIQGVWRSGPSIGIEKDSHHTANPLSDGMVERFNPIITSFYPKSLTSTNKSGILLSLFLRSIASQAMRVPNRCLQKLFLEKKTLIAMRLSSRSKRLRNLHKSLRIVLNKSMIKLVKE